MRKLIGKMIEWFLDYPHIVKFTNDGLGHVPDHKYAGDAGYDLYCSRTTKIAPHSNINVPSGVCIQSDDRLWFELMPRSSTMRVKGLHVIEAVIDNDYTGEMFACVYNPSDEEKIVEKGDRIVQIVPHRLLRCKFKYVEKLGDRTRGSNGFGSTGK